MTKRSLPDIIENHDTHVEDGRKYLLATFHRPENVDDEKKLKSIIYQFSREPLPAIIREMNYTNKKETL